jgi:hypothetical protein
MAKFDLICKQCGNTVYNFIKSMADPFPMCEQCDNQMQRNWKSMGTPGVSWKGPGGSPLVCGGPSKRSFNTNQDEVENEMYHSITEEDD